jgi:23S rRNA (uracil1939-C5)-methyltransferase
MPSIEIKIEKLIYGGDGLAHHDGATVFVPFVMSDERVLVEPIEQKKKFVRARVNQLIEASPNRTPPRCKHFGVCGGCNYQHIPYDSQLPIKTEILRETLRRIGHVDWQGEITTHASPPWGYRNRAQWKVRPIPDASTGSSASESSRLAIGYFRANSTALCPIEDCAILSPPLLQAFHALREGLASGAFPRQLREVEVFAAPGEGSNSPLLLTATFAGFPSRIGEHAGKIRATVPGLESVLLHDPGHERMELLGPGFIEYRVNNVAYRVGHFSFFQVNDFLVQSLVDESVGREDHGRIAFDLYAGVGLFSVPLAERFERVVAVEANPAAARDLTTNTRANGAIEVRASDVEEFLARCKESPELVVLDPPRAGLSPGAAERLAHLAPQRMNYVSCEPPTLARDLAALQKLGYEISAIHLFDLFPQTFHMEVVVRLTRHQ